MSSESTLERVLHQLQDAAIIVDAETGRVRVWNRAAERFFGYPESEALDQPLERFIPAAGKVFDFDEVLEFVALRRSGEPLPIELTWSRLDEVHRDHPWVLAIIRAGSQSRMASEARLAETAKRSNALLQAQLDAATDGILVVDEQQRVVGYNQRFLELWSLDPAAMARADVAAVLAVLRPKIADWPEFRRRLEERLAPPHDARRDEIRLLDGRVFEGHPASARGEHGEDFGQVWFWRDLSGQKRLEGELREKDRWFRAVFDGAGYGICMVTPDGLIAETNPAFRQLLGYSGEELRHHSVTDFTHPDDVASSRQYLEELLARRRDYYKLEKRYLRKDGQVVWTILTVYRLASTENEPALTLGIVEDVTERKRMEETLRQQCEQLKALDRFKTDFINSVSHDLRTPLTVILAYAEFLEDGIAGQLSSAQAEYLLQIKKGTKRLEWLVSDLLDVARLEAGTFHLHCETVDFGFKVREVLDGMKPQFDAARIHVELPSPDPPLILDMDPERIEQVLFNLVNNAFKFSPEGGTLRITAAVTQGQLDCAVIDQGPGIAAEDLPRLFQRFSQLESGKREKGGTGLGLSICKAIVEAHGGTIGVRSQPGVGSNFWFRIPLRPPGCACEPSRRQHGS